MPDPRTCWQSRSPLPHEGCKFDAPSFWAFVAQLQSCRSWEGPTSGGRAPRLRAAHFWKSHPTLALTGLGVMLMCTMQCLMSCGIQSRRRSWTHSLPPHWGGMVHVRYGPKFGSQECEWGRPVAHEEGGVSPPMGVVCCGSIAPPPLRSSDLRAYRAQECSCRRWWDARRPCFRRKGWRRLWAR